jgi:hypothetical protein
MRVSREEIFVLISALYEYKKYLYTYIGRYGPQGMDVSYDKRQLKVVLRLEKRLNRLTDPKYLIPKWEAGYKRARALRNK